MRLKQKLLYEANSINIPKMVISKLPEQQEQGGPMHYVDDGGREEFDRNRIRCVG